MSRPIEIDDPTPAGIAGAIARMISSGELAAGDRLPTVRELSAQLGVSPATVSHGWQALSQAGLVVSRGRSGTFVAEAKSSAPQPAPPRAARMVKGATTARLDLSLGTPDPALLPELGPLLAHVALNSEPTDYHQAPVVPELGRLLQQHWPTGSGGLTVVDGAMDAVARGLRAVVRYGDRVIVENPTFPHFLDYLESIGAQPIPVAMDERGVLPDEFERALALAPAAAVIQPRAQNPTGASMDDDRIKDLAMILRRSETRCVVLEDDHSGSIIPTPDLSIGRWLPDQVLHVRSYSKSHGPDLRIAALSGPEEVIDRVVSTRMLGPGWTPRILQHLLYELLQDDTAIRAVANARTQYHIRRSSFVDALDHNGVRVPPGEGLNVWVPVADERSALVHLAANGVRVAPGDPFYADPHNHPQAVRVTISPLRGGGEEVARILAATSEPHQRDYFSLGGPDRDSPPRRRNGRTTPGMR